MTEVPSSAFRLPESHPVSASANTTASSSVSIRFILMTPMDVPPVCVGRHALHTARVLRRRRTGIAQHTLMHASPHGCGLRASAIRIFISTKSYNDPAATVNRTSYTDPFCFIAPRRIARFSQTQSCGNTACRVASPACEFPCRETDRHCTNVRGLWHGFTHIMMQLTI